MSKGEHSYGAAPRNQLLASLSSDVFKQLRSKMSAVTISPRQILHERNLPIRAAYFPSSGWASLVISFADGFQVGTGLVGSEGMTGICLLAGVRTETTDAVVQTVGEALAIGAADFRQAIELLPELKQVLQGHAEVTRAHTTQLVACNGHHNLEQRLARWLLMMDDRSQSNDVPVTQELLAMMLSVHRPSVTVAAGRLQRAGLIRYAVRHITILDRPALTEVACECYHKLKEQFSIR